MPIPSVETREKLPPDGGPEFNRLIHEKSPYLLQHARNPVDWYPWGEEAFARARKEERTRGTCTKKRSCKEAFARARKEERSSFSRSTSIFSEAAFARARKEEKPVFLSIGYSTCHWCHVMERESFEDNEVAEILNRHFIAIKVDREERPDIDEIYMNATNMLHGRGGWPNSVWLTPEKKPWYAGTYFPPEDKYGRPGFKSVLVNLSQAWSIGQSVCGRILMTRSYARGTA